MVPRMIFDLGWPDLAAGAVAAVTARDRAVAAARAERAFGGDPACTLAMLSVRSGFSALLAALALPAGARIAFSAVTIRDMQRIAAHHGVQVDAFDIDPQTLAPDLDSLRRVLAPETKAIVVAHLFGARSDLSAVRAIADERGILLLEDCAQAWTGDGWIGHPASDVAFFSFGPIKTATALGGAVLRFRTPALRERVAAVQATWPVQSQVQFARRVAKFSALATLSVRPVFTAFTRSCDALGTDWDALIAQSARGFHGGDFFARIHTQPCAALLALLHRRLRQAHGDRMARRARAAAEVLRAAPGCSAPGTRAATHTHWVLPLEFEHPRQAAEVLRRHGFDATRGTSSMTVIGDSPATAAPRARGAENRWLYVPCHRRMSAGDRARLARAIQEAMMVSAPGPAHAEPARMPVPMRPASSAPVPGVPAPGTPARGAPAPGAPAQP